jgi:hypothetical protein
MFTRNLIGSLAASAFRLTDPDDRIGIWFVLQDLSVRTEGTFRYVPFPSPFLHHLTSQTPLLLRQRRGIRLSDHLQRPLGLRRHDRRQYRQSPRPRRLLLRGLHRLLG